MGKTSSFIEDIVDTPKALQLVRIHEYTSQERKGIKSINRFTCANKLPAPLPSPFLFHRSSTGFSSFPARLSCVCVCQHSLGLIFRLQHKLKLTDKTQKGMKGYERTTQQKRLFYNF